MKLHSFLSFSIFLIKTLELFLSSPHSAFIILGYLCLILSVFICWYFEEEFRHVDWDHQYYFKKSLRSGSVRKILTFHKYLQQTNPIDFFRWKTYFFLDISIFLEYVWITSIPESLKTLSLKSQYCILQFPDTILSNFTKPFLYDKVCCKCLAKGESLYKHRFLQNLWNIKPRGIIFSRQRFF